VKNARLLARAESHARLLWRGDSRISEPTLAAILVRDKRYHFDLWVDGFYDARQIP
jgi:hypothetical protein